MATDTRERLVRVARELIHSSTFADVSVEDICAEAGVHRGSLYHFFPSKEALGLAVLEANWAMMTALLDEAFSADVAPLERIDRFLRSFGGMLAAARLQIGATPGCPLGNLAAELSAQQGQARTSIASIFDAWARRLADTIQEAQLRGEVDPAVAAEDAALRVLAYVQGLALLAKAYDRPDLIEQAPAGVRLLLQSTTSASAG
jgi:TetR/AcrR family transcriptional repressor of nem operon